MAPTKTDRIIVRMMPSLAQELRAIAAKRGLSMNATVILAVEEYVRRERRKAAMYDDVGSIDGA